MSAAIDIRSRPPTTAVVVDVTTDYAGISDAFDTAFRGLADYMSQQGITATGPACIGCAALSTRRMKSASWNRLVMPVEMLDVESAVCPMPCPSSRTTFGKSPSYHFGANGPATRMPSTTGVSSRPKFGA